MTRVSQIVPVGQVANLGTDCQSVHPSVQPHPPAEPRPSGRGQTAEHAKTGDCPLCPKAQSVRGKTHSASSPRGQSGLSPIFAPARAPLNRAVTAGSGSAEFDRSPTCPPAIFSRSQFKKLPIGGLVGPPILAAAALSGGSSQLVAHALLRAASPLVAPLKGGTDFSLCSSPC
jgi:hypothetical protein